MPENTQSAKRLTKDQKMAQAAYGCVSKRKGDKDFNFDDYSNFAYAFPALIHSCGLVQAVAFAKAKGKADYIADLQAVFDRVDDAGDLYERSRAADLSEYARISRHALAAASWLKRYCQAMDGGAYTDE